MMQTEGTHPESPEWPIYHVAAMPDEGVGGPYDPNGCIFWKGRYHLMYIFQDPSLPNGGHCWGHWSSSDLVNWTRHPATLVPSAGDPDTGIFSGNAFVDKEGVPMLCWFGIDAGVCVATAEDDDLIRWRKHPANPIIPIPKEGEAGHGVYTVWDPYLWLEGDTYYCLLGGNRLADGKDTLYLCRSSDLVEWTPLHAFYEHADPRWTVDDEDCSCPDFFRLGDRHVLLCISHKVGARCYVGAFDRQSEKFLPSRHIRMNWLGGMFFAPESMEDDLGRRIVWAWVTDPRVGPTQKRDGSGIQSLPRMLSFDEAGELVIEPVPELAALRRRHTSVTDRLLPAGEEVHLPQPRGRHMELEIEIEMGSATVVEVGIYCSPDAAEETVIRYDEARGTLFFDMSRSTLRDDVGYGQPPFAAGGWKTATDNPHPVAAVVAPFRRQEARNLLLRLFLDGPVVEVFADRSQAIVRLAARGGSARLVRLDAWEMSPALFVDAKADGERTTV